MSKKNNLVFYLVMLLLAPFASVGQSYDTAGELKKIVIAFKALRNMGYDYKMDVQFPNMEHDHLKGLAYLSNDNKRYYNDCDAFTMIYTERWLYKADHRKKILTIVDINLDYNKKLKKATEKDIFQNGAVNTFLDSVLLKTARITSIARKDNVVEVDLVFRQTALVRNLHISYDEANHLPIQYNMTVHTPWQTTPKGVQVVETKIECNNFKQIADDKMFNEENLFSFKKGKFELKKYTDYKFSTQM